MDDLSDPQMVLRAASTLATCAGVYAKVFELSNLEQRVADLEAKAAQNRNGR